MPRTHGRIWAAIWNDPDFIALDPPAQRLYMFLISQSDLSHAGLVPMRIRRWASKSKGLNPRDLEDTLDRLCETEFVIADWETEEVLIRTFVRNDQVYKQPKVMVRLREDAKQIESATLRAAFRAELLRLPLNELSTNGTGPHGDGPSTFRSVKTVVDALLGDFADATEGVSDTHSDTPRVRAGGFSQPPTTVPHTQPPATSIREKPSSDKSDHTPERFGEFWDTYGNKVGRAKSVVAYRAALKKPGVTDDLLISAAAAYVLWCNQTGTFIKNPLTWLHGEHWQDERPTTAPLTNVQRHLQLAADLARAEGPQQPQPRQIGPSA